MAHLEGLVKPYYDQGIRSILAENMVLQAVSRDRHARYLEARLQADAIMAGGLRPNDRKDMFESVFERFHHLKGMLLNRRFDPGRVKRKAEFDVMVRKAAAAGEIGDNPVNVRPDLKISRDEADTRKAAGETIPEWYIRTDEEEEAVKIMVAEWKALKKRRQGGDT